MNAYHKYCDLLVLGHPRCGSASLASAFRRAGVEIGHERLLAQGMVSWWHTGFLHGHPTQKIFRKSAIDKPSIKAGAVWWYIRRPSDAIPSIIIENEFNERNNASFKHRHRVILEKYGLDISRATRFGAAAYSYLLWNQIAETLSDDKKPIKIEKPHLDHRLNTCGIFELPRINTTHGKFGRKKEVVSLTRILQDVDTETKRKILQIEEEY